MLFVKNTNICSDAPPSPGTLHYRMVLQFARVMRSVTLTTPCTVSRTTATASTVTPPAERACQVGQLTVGWSGQHLRSFFLQVVLGAKTVHLA